MGLMGPSKLRVRLPPTPKICPPSFPPFYGQWCWPAEAPPARDAAAGGPDRFHHEQRMQIVPPRQPRHPFAPAGRGRVRVGRGRPGGGTGGLGRAQGRAARLAGMTSFEKAVEEGMHGAWDSQKGLKIQRG